MKQGIHPEYMECTVKCSCGNVFTTMSTKPELKIDICNVCHPFYTGQQRFVDTGGRVQRFADKFGSAKDTVAEREAAKRLLLWPKPRQRRRLSVTPRLPRRQSALRSLQRSLKLLPPRPRRLPLPLLLSRLLKPRLRILLRLTLSSKRRLPSNKHSRTIASITTNAWHRAGRSLFRCKASNGEATT